MLTTSQPFRKHEVAQHFLSVLGQADGLWHREYYQKHLAQHIDQAYHNGVIAAVNCHGKRVGNTNGLIGREFLVAKNVIKMHHAEVNVYQKNWMTNSCRK